MAAIFALLACASGVYVIANPPNLEHPSATCGRQQERTRESPPNRGSGFGSATAHAESSRRSSTGRGASVPRALFRERDDSYLIRRPSIAALANFSASAAETVAI